MPARSRGLVRAMRIWPSASYTRLTVESGMPLTYKYLELEDPPRLAIDFIGIAPAELRPLAQGALDAVATAPDESHIRSIRIGENRPGVSRMVVDLKRAGTPQIFTLDPVGEYGHRLVVDLQSEQAEGDEIMRFLEMKKEAQESARKNGKTISKIFTVALDPGHGGEDPGAVGPGGTYEKHVTLAIARRLKERIDALDGLRAVLTRDGDYFVPLHRRVQLARNAKADLFVSVHADAFIKPTARGGSVFILSEKGASSTAARWLADKENDADLIGGIRLGSRDTHLAKTLLDLSMTATIQESNRIGREVLQAMGRVNTLHKNEVEQAGFAVLKAPDIPSILIETAFISNPEEERRLKSPDFQDRMAEAIFTGILEYQRRA